MGLSRNKVAVPEGAAGTPPFWSALKINRRVLMLFGIRNGKERLKSFSSLRFDVPELTWTAPCLHFVYVSYIDHAGYAGRDTGNREASSGDRSPGVPLLGIQNP